MRFDLKPSGYSESDLVEVAKKMGFSDDMIAEVVEAYRSKKPPFDGSGPSFAYVDGPEGLFCGHEKISGETCLKCPNESMCCRWLDFQKNSVFGPNPRKIRSAERRKAYEKYGGRCAYCGKEISFEEMELDHVIPVSCGGSKEQSNLMPACHDCNQAKGGLTPDAFRLELKSFYLKVFQKRKKPKRFLSDRIALDYGLDKDPNKEIVFYFERTKEKKT